MRHIKAVGIGVLVASVVVLAVAGLGWVLVPAWRPAIAAIIILSPIPPVP